MENNKNKKIYIFILYLIVSGIFVVIHEPWRDEIHAWLMSKSYNILELLEASRFDGHPILWHIILMPFAKIGFNVIFLNIINYIIVSLSAGIFFFKKDELSNKFKIFTLFSIPFMYVYSSFARNYSLILLMMVLISYLYKDRYSKPLLYSIFICLLIHTHSLAWGIVAGLTITFHINEIIKYIKTKNKPQKYLEIIMGFILIILNTIIVIMQLLGSGNNNFQVFLNTDIILELLKIIIILITVLFMNIFNKRLSKEYLILLFGYIFIIIVYFTYYSALILQRTMLIYVYLLFYIDIVTNTQFIKKENLKKYFALAYIIIFFIMDAAFFIEYPFLDFNQNYSSAKEMANYINENMKEDTEILTPCSVYTQTIIPYCKENIYQYDIVYNMKVNCANVEFDYEKSTESMKKIANYENRYLLLNNILIDNVPENCELIYSTQDSLCNEKYYLYYIKK